MACVHRMAVLAAWANHESEGPMLETAARKINGRRILIAGPVPGPICRGIGEGSIPFPAAAGGIVVLPRIARLRLLRLTGSRGVSCRFP